MLTYRNLSIVGLVSAREERSDELRRHMYLITALADTYVLNVATVDFATISNVINTFSFATCFCFSQVMSMALQIFVVTFNYRRLGARRVAREIAIVLFGFKPPWDAYKVGLGRKTEQGVEWDPIMEMTFSKVIEMFTESIPSVMIQSSAILDSMKSGHGISKVAMFSLAISTLTTGFVSATISYDFDTNPSNRVARSEFYGYVNDSPMARGEMLRGGREFYEDEAKPTRTKRRGGCVI
jgi:hypothetical protein